MTILRRAYTTTASFFVLAVLVLQSYASIAPAFGKGTGWQWWPLVSYAMYSRPHYEGDTVEVYDLLEGTLHDGSVVEIPMEGLGLSVWYYRDMVRGLREKDPAAVALLISRFHLGEDLAEVRIKSYPLMVTRDGPAKKPSEILYTLTLSNRTYAEND